MADYDLIVVGGGPAGYVGAIRSGQLGKKVAVVEMDRAGGILCLLSTRVVASSGCFDFFAVFLALLLYLLVVILHCPSLPVNVR